MVDWTALHPELLQAILDRLPFPVHTAFRSVCRSWRAISPIPPPTRPFIIADRLDDGGRLVYTAFNLNGEEMGPLEISHTCCGSSYGWLALADYPMSVHLMNPITRHLLHLPDFPSGDFAFDKIITSSDPADLSAGDCILMAFRHDWNCIGFSKPPYDTWTEISLLEFVEQDILDAVYHKGAFYVVNDEAVYILVVSDINHPEVDGFDIVEHRGDLPEGDFYLVGSGDDLLLVIVVLDGTPNFEVIKISWVDGEDNARTATVESLGERAVFLSRLQSFSLPASEFPGCRMNCIYISELYLDDGTLFKIYNMEDKSLTTVKHPGASPDGRNWDPCTWFIPTLFPDPLSDNV